MAVIAVTTDKFSSIRSRHFFKTLELRGHQIFEYPENTKKPPNADVWIFEYINATNLCDVNIARLQYWLPQFKRFRGKIALMSLGDSCPIYANRFTDDLLSNIDCIISFLRFPPSSAHSKNVYEKIVLLPRYTLHEDVQVQNMDYNTQRENKIFFVGRITGSVFFDGKNWRIEAFKKILKNDFLHQHFIGWLCADKDHQISYRLAEKTEYMKTVVGTKIHTISNKEYYSNLQRYQISLCLPGNTAWGYRHLQSLMCNNTIISFPLENDPGEWLFQDKFNDSFYFLSKDLNNFDEILTYAINNFSENVKRAENSHATYAKYFKLDNNTAYKPEVWNIVCNSLQKCGIQL